jgi:putative inorganic carbon (HCO3(-)) transporter
MIYFLLLTFILAPTYVIRFNFLHLPANLLMVWVFLFWIIFGLWLIINRRTEDFIRFKLSLDKKIAIPLTLFFLAGLISLFVGGIDRSRLGQFIVLFLEPIPTFFIAGYIFKEYPESKNLLLTTIYLLLGLAGIYAIVQYFTLLGLPAAWWGNSQEPKRALSFFVHPNFYALWCAPLLAFLLPNLGSRFKVQGSRAAPWMTAWIVGAAGLLLSLSRSGWLGLAAAVIVYLIVAADKKTRKIILAGAIVAAALVLYYPNLRWRVILPFYGEKSADSRVELWGDGLRAVKESPILGLGLTGFANQYGTLNSDEALDTHNFPHNIFLNFWVETGLLGLISFLWLIGLYIYHGIRPRPNGVILNPSASEGEESQTKIEILRRSAALTAQDDAIKLGISLFLIALVFQGLVDNPYFKNDLALVFWIIISLTLL